MFGSGWGGGIVRRIFVVCSILYRFEFSRKVRVLSVVFFNVVFFWGVVVWRRYLFFVS